MITEEQARDFTNDWIESWNSHDIDRIMSHYDNNVEYFSTFISKLTDNKTGMLQGKSKVKEFLSRGLEAYPDLCFKLLNVFIGVRSIVIHYQTVNDLIAAEVFELNDKGLAVRVQCHQTHPQPSN